MRAIISNKPNQKKAKANKTKKIKMVCNCLKIINRWI